MSVKLKSKISLKRSYIIILLVSFLILAIGLSVLLIALNADKPTVEIKKGDSLDGKTVYDIIYDENKYQFYVGESLLSEIDDISANIKYEIILTFKNGKQFNLGKYVGQGGESLRISGIDIKDKALNVFLTDGGVLSVSDALENDKIAGLYLNNKGSLCLHLSNNAKIGIGKILFRSGESSVSMLEIGIKPDGELFCVFSNDIFVEFGALSENSSVTLFDLYKQKHGFDGSKTKFEEGICLKTVEFTKIHNVIFQSADVGYSASQKILNGEKCLTPTSPEKKGYVFGGWDMNGEIVDLASFSVTSDLVFSAKWIPIEYMVTYNTDGGTYEGVLSYNIESKSFTLGTPEKNGYKFIGWTSADIKTPELSPKINKGSVGNLEFFANYEVITYNLTYDLSGGDGENPKNYTIESESFTLAAPERFGYAFSGWLINGEEELVKSIEIAKGTYGDFSFTAVFTPVEYKIKYELSGGIADNPLSYNIETSDFTLNFPTKNGYVFSGWKSEDLTEPVQTLTVKTGSAGDKTFVAIWKPIVYTIKYFSEYGAVENPLEYTVESETIVLEPPTSFTRDFLGWFDSFGNEVVEISKGSCGNLELTAKFGDSIFIILDGSLTGISDNAKLLCKEIIIPKGIEAVLDDVFSDSEALTAIEFSDDVHTIGSGAFKNCKNLKTVIFGSGLLSINSKAFNNCTNIESFILPENIFYIGENAFLGCDSLIHLEFFDNSTWEILNEDGIFIPESAEENASLFKSGNKKLIKKQ